MMHMPAPERSIATSADAEAWRPHRSDSMMYTALNNLCESTRVTMMMTYRPGACGVYVSRLASLENVFSPPF